MKTAQFFMLSLLLCTSCLYAGVQEQVQYIRDIYSQTNEEVDNGELYKTVVDVNTGGLSYPAVGTYHPLLTFYFGFSEENPYPDNLRKAILIVDRAAYHEYSEFLYDGFGNLIFVYMTGIPQKPEMRYYYYQGELIKVVEDSSDYTSFNSEQVDRSNSVQDQSETLIGTFNRLFY
ncbi:MAG: hypothetical protein K8S15_07845 [Candidatus Aegiribacteria sp.]|nr:hypothetical protein [Candidatus Aegiribacteria sp.]